MTIKNNVVGAILLLAVVNNVLATAHRNYGRTYPGEERKVSDKKRTMERWEFGSDLAMDMYHKNGDIIAKMNVPGIDQGHLQVRIEDGNLHVSGKREEKSEIKEKDYYQKEIKCGSFNRVISLPEDINEDAMTWELSDGVLTVTIPKE